jgi:predicted nucleic acid-binding protein
VALLIDTDVAIHLRDGHSTINARLRGEGASPVISVLTLVELEASAANDVVDGYRLVRLAAMLAFVPVLPYTPAEAAAYGRIVGALGFDRRRMFDRMIAAQAIVAGLPLATINARDYRDIPDLDLLVWTLP